MTHALVTRVTGDRLLSFHTTLSDSCADSSSAHVAAAPRVFMLEPAPVSRVCRRQQPQQKPTTKGARDEPARPRNVECPLAVLRFAVAPTSRQSGWLVAASVACSPVRNVLARCLGGRCVCVCDTDTHGDVLLHPIPATSHTGAGEANSDRLSPPSLGYFGCHREGRRPRSSRDLLLGCSCA